MLAGTAFDYLLRLEWRRRGPEVAAAQWVAELLPDLIGKENNSTIASMDIVHGVDARCCLPPKEIAARARSILRDARAAFVDYIKRKMPTTDEQAELARHAIRSADSDRVIRALQLGPGFEEASSEHIEGLV